MAAHAPWPGSSPPFVFAIAALAQRFGFQREREGPRPTFPATGEFHFVRAGVYRPAAVPPRLRIRLPRATRRRLVDGRLARFRRALHMGVERLSRIDIGDPLHFRAHRSPPVRQSMGVRHADRLVGSRTTPRSPGCASTSCAAASWWSTISGVPNSGRSSASRWTASSRQTDHRYRALGLRDARSLRHRGEGSDLDSRHPPSAAGTWRRDDGPAARGTAPAWRAIYDDRNRMVVAVNFNTDVGDAWEYADSPITRSP